MRTLRPSVSTHDDQYPWSEWLASHLSACAKTLPALHKPHLHTAILCEVSRRISELEGGRITNCRPFYIRLQLDKPP